MLSPLSTFKGFKNMKKPQRIAVAGASGVGKTTLCQQLEGILGYPRVELDSLYHGEQWTPRPSFLPELSEFIAGEQWICEYQYPQARPLIVARADTLLWLDFQTSLQMRRLTQRTLFRSISKKPLWNNNIEPPLWTIFKDPDHILRWAWQSRKDLKRTLPELQKENPQLQIVRFKSPRELKKWTANLALAGVDE